MELRKSSRKKAKMRIGLSAVAGGGKTYSALLLAYGITGDWNKIAMIDSEAGSGELYSGSPNIGEYNYVRLDAPYTPENYIKAIKMCEDAADIEVIIIDSITHEWSGKGGILEIHGAMTGNSFTNWSSVTPRHQRFIDAILTSRCHIITTVRRKTEYEISKDANNKVTIEKIGQKEQTREDFEYEVTVNLQIGITHLAKASKDRTGLFMDEPEFVITTETGKIILDWCEKGIEPPKQDIERDLRACTTLAELSVCFLDLSPDNQRKYVGIKDEMKLALTPPPAPVPDRNLVNLNSCTTLAALQKAWTAIPADQKPLYEQLKNDIKAKLTPAK